VHSFKKIYVGKKVGQVVLVTSILCILFTISKDTISFGIIISSINLERYAVLGVDTKF